MIARLLALLLAAIPAAASAQIAPSNTATGTFCAALRDPGAVAQVRRLLPDGRPTATIQQGLRGYLRSGDRFVAERGLTDAIVGVRTVAALATLCEATPLSPMRDPFTDTLTLADDYAALSEMLPAWRTVIDRPSIFDDRAPAGFDRRFVKLAASPAMAAAALTGAVSQPAVCAVAAAGVDGLPAERKAAVLRAVAAVAAADPTAMAPTANGAARVAAVCAAYPTVGGADAALSALVRLGEILAARPDAVAVLGAPDFHEWLRTGSQSGAWPGSPAARLLGSGPAVVRLLEDHARDRGESASPPTPPDDAPPPESPSACAPSAGGFAQYYALDNASITAIKARSDVRAALAPLADKPFADQPRDMAGLASAVGEALGAAPESCAAERIMASLQAESARSQAFGVDVATVAMLGAASALAPLLPALDDMRPRVTEDRDALVAQAVMALTDEARRQAVASADAVAAAAAAAAPSPSQQGGDGDSGPDEAVIEALREMPPPPPTPAIVLDAALIDTLAARLAGAEARYIDAIAALEGLTAPDRASLEAAVRQALAPEIAAAVADAAREAADLLGAPDVLARRWRLTEPVLAALAADPEVAGVDFDPASRLAALNGIAYPFERLMRVAAEVAPVSLPAPAAASLAQLSRRIEPATPRVTGPFAKGCGCVAPRRENAIVFSFYPYWLADPAPDPIADPDPGAARDAPPPPSLAQVNFEAVERIAFDAMRIGGDGVLRGRALWDAAAPNFIYSALKHQAAPEIAVRLKDWTEWSADGEPGGGDAIAAAVLEATRAVGFPQGEGWRDRAASWIDRRFLTLRPAGVTLMLERRMDAAEALGPVLTLARRLRDGLPRGAHVNIAFDLDLDLAAEEAQQAFLRQFAPALSGDSARTVDTLLVFLQRRTTDTKKTLRDIIEDSFHGEERKRFLRSVIPVAPPGAHAAVQSSDPALRDAPFGQLRDDLIYVQDNFGGIGFWPTPVTDRDVDVETEVMKLFAAARGLEANTEATSLERLLISVRAVMTPVCNVTCPRRFAIYTVMIGVAASLVLIVALAPFVGLFDRMARSPTVVMAHVAVLLALLLLTETCDAPSQSWALLGFLALLALAVGFLVTGWQNERTEGPPP